MNKENIPSRAYIAFKSEEQLALFGKDYDGHLFRDKAGVLLSCSFSLDD
jgi:regulator of nonsense transcripts 3